MFRARRDYVLGSSLPEASAMESGILLRVTIQALLDVAIGKPCDLGLWQGDYSPCLDKGTKCTKLAHSCELDAYRFLHDLEDQHESFMGLETGTIRLYISKIKEQNSVWSSAFVGVVPSCS
jgi:hypothetical protein